MTDPNDDLNSVADPGVPSGDEQDSLGGHLANDRSDTAGDDGAGTPGAAIDSPAAQGSPIGPPD